MPPSDLPQIAVIADPHFHDLYGDYDFAGLPGRHGRLSIRTLADTARSTRVFNESYGALIYALDDVVARGIRHVVLLGDYSDDGQVATLFGLQRLLDRYRADHGLQFYATVGNHDIFGPAGRHRSKRFANGDGSYTLVTSNPDMVDPAAAATIVTEKMFCEGYPAGLEAVRDIGFFRNGDELHWESPFGPNDDPAVRVYTVTSPDGQTVRRLMDASYLVEPFAGVWLLMIDANVFAPLNSGSGDGPDFADSTDAGWNGMLQHKAFIPDWIKDVSERARQSGKMLLGFSHYPAVDPLDGTLEDELALIGATGLSRRIPRTDVAEALLAAGLTVHFSGHLHIQDTARHVSGSSALVNIAVPSLVAFPAAYKVLDVMPDGLLRIATVEIAAMPLDAEITDLYREEIERSGLKAGAMLAAETYGDFLSAHLGHLVERRYLRREWPRDLAEVITALTLGDVAMLALAEQPVPIADTILHVAALRHDTALSAGLDGLGIDRDLLDTLPMVVVLADWYRFRMASDLATDYVSADRLAVYAALSDIYASGRWDGGVQEKFQRLFRMFDRYRNGLASRDIRIDVGSGRMIEGRSTSRPAGRGCGLRSARKWCG